MLHVKDEFSDYKDCKATYKGDNLEFGFMDWLSLTTNENSSTYKDLVIWILTLALHTETTAA